MTLSSYSIIKYRLFDIGIVIRKSLIIVLLLTIYVLLILGISMGISNIFEIGFNSLTILSLVLTFIIIIITLKPLKKLLDNILLKEYYDLSENIEKLKSEFEAENTIEKLAIRVAQKSRDVLEIDDVYFFIFEPIKNKFVSQFPRLGEVTFKSQDDLCKIMVEFKQMIIEKEIEFMIEQRPELKDLLNSTRRLMRRLNIEILVPLTLGGKILGAVAFGKKKNGELYTSDNIKTLKGFSEQLSVALASVQNYENTLKFIQNDLT